MIKWVVCRGNSGHLVNNGLRERRKTAFDKDAIGQVKISKEKNMKYGLLVAIRLF